MPNPGIQWSMMEGTGSRSIRWAFVGSFEVRLELLHKHSRIRLKWLGQIFDEDEKCVYELEFPNMQEAKRLLVNKARELEALPA